MRVFLVICSLLVGTDYKIEFVLQIHEHFGNIPKNIIININIINIININIINIINIIIIIYSNTRTMLSITNSLS